MSFLRSVKRSVRPGLAMAAAGVLSLAGCAGGIGETFSAVNGGTPEPVLQTSSLPAAEAVPVEPLAIAEPEPALPRRAAYPNLNVIPQEPEGQLLTPDEQKTIGAELRERAERMRSGDGPLLQHMRRQSEALRARVGALTRNNDEADPACGDVEGTDCPR